MANKVTFDYSLTENVISADEIKSMEKITNDAKELLLSKEGAGSDFLGWIDLPIDYDKEEFARIQKAAEKIQSDSEVLLVIGIGGSYLGATYDQNSSGMFLWGKIGEKWENGKYNFTDIPLQELISIINQMYNSDVTLAKGINHESAFTGSIRYDEPLEDVVNKICFTLNLNKEEHANKIIIKK